MSGAVCLCTALISLLLPAGCAGKREEVGWESREVTEITVAVWDVDEAFVGDGVLEEVERRFNIRLVPMNITWDDYYQRIEQWASTGNLPDLFVGDFRSSPLYTQWIEQGLLKEIPKELSAYPHLEAYLNTPGIIEDALQKDRLYCIPRQTYSSQEWTSIDRIVSYRWDLAQQAGIEKEPETWEEFCEMILAVIQADPEGMNIQGMTADGSNLLGGLIMSYSSSIAVDEGTNYKWVMDSDGLYRPAYFVVDQIPGLQLGRDMYTSGVIDPDILLTTEQSSQDKFLKGKNAALLSSGGFGGKYEDVAVYWPQFHDGRDYTDDVKALRLMPDVNGNKTYPVWGYAWSESYINGRVSEEKLDRILALYDYLLSEEGAFFTTYGPEGEFYEVTDGRVQMYDENRLVSEKYPSTRVFSILVRWNPSSYDERFVTGIPEIYRETDRMLVREAETVAIPEYNEKCAQIVQEKQLYFPIRQQEDFLRIMTGSRPVEEMWEETVRTYEEEGLEKLVKEVNDAL